MKKAAKNHFPSNLNAIEAAAFAYMAFRIQRNSCAAKVTAESGTALTQELPSARFKIL